ncbi:hypothetical protein [Arthrobacter sp. H41]|uniref:hypothetical protein n=1 Tax=Arthrobacter sp. H41 TaxID=1312978 RepID=UPI00047D0361|nr:hypothetical protein [Arthrobacter sp. H41]
MNVQVGNRRISDAGTADAFGEVDAALVSGHTPYLDSRFVHKGDGFVAAVELGELADEIL